MPKVHYDNWKVLDESRGRGSHWQVLGYPRFVSLGDDKLDVSRIIASGKDVRQAAVLAATPLAEAVHPLHPIKHVRIQLDNSAIYLEPGAMQFTRGQIEMTTGGTGGVGGFFRRAVNAVASGETMTKPRYHGSGDVFLEPRRDHLLLLEVNESKVMCDRGMFVACDASLEVGAHFPGVIAATQGGEGFALPTMTGSGVVLLSSPVPMSRILRVELDNEELRVDGPFAMVAMGDLAFTVEKSSKSFLSSASSGEGLVNVYRGTGQVWMNLQEAKCFA